MATVNLHAAKTHLSKLVDAAAAGEEIVIARAGKPVARLVALEPAQRAPRRLGTLAGKFPPLPEDFDTMFAEEIRAMFEEGPIFPDAKPTDAKPTDAKPTGGKPA
jgi:prevent-host-death family protein